MNKKFIKSFMKYKDYLSTHTDKFVLIKKVKIVTQE
jgi:hypothetical protein